jgi:hypothetical protein
VREATAHAAALTLQNQRMERLQAVVETGHMALLGHITNIASQQVVTRQGASKHLLSDHNEPSDRPLPVKTRHRKSRIYRIALPRWLVGRVWEFAVHESNSVRKIQLYSLNMRPSYTYAFDFVRSGDTATVRELLNSGQLSVLDRSADEEGGTLLEVRSLQCFLHQGTQLTVGRWQRLVVTSSSAAFCSAKVHSSTKTP